MARLWNGAYCQSLSAVARAKYESNMSVASGFRYCLLLDRLSNSCCSLLGGRKELYMSDRFKHPTTQQVLLDRRATLSLYFAPNVKFYV